MPVGSFDSGLEAYNPELADCAPSADLGSQHNAYEVLPEANTVHALLSTSPRKEKENVPLPTLQELPEEVKAAEPKSKAKARATSEGASKSKVKSEDDKGDRKGSHWTTREMSMLLRAIYLPENDKIWKRVESKNSKVWKKVRHL